MNYGDLRRSVQTYTSNTDPEFLSQIDTFIRQTESRIGMLVHLPNYKAQTPIATVANVQTISISPGVTDFIAVESINLLDYGTLEQKETSFLEEAYPNNGEVGPPRYFAMHDDLTLTIGPVPDAVYSMILHYTKKWPSLVDLGHAPLTINNETFISSKFETSLLNGTLMNAAMFMKDAESYQGHKAEFMEGLGLVTQFAKGAAQKQRSEKTDSANDGVLI